MRREVRGKKENKRKIILTPRSLTDLSINLALHKWEKGKPGLFAEASKGPESKATV